MVFGEGLSRINFNSSYVDGIALRKMVDGMEFEGEDFLYRFQQCI